MKVDSRASRRIKNKFVANDVWELVPQPRNMKIIGTKWVFRNKLDENGIVSRNKARLVAQGYNQQEDIDYDETYAPIARLDSIKILLAYDETYAPSAFLNGFINEEFEMSMMGELNFFLGLQIKQMEDGIFFNQSKYIKETLKKFGLEESKLMKTPMSSDTKLTKDEECESVDSTKYRGMIGSLLYLTASRPDIMFSVCLCARFQEAPKTSHLEAVKRIFRYIKGTTHLGLWYPKGTGIETVVYADSDHARDYVDRKSTAIATTEAEYSVCIRPEEEIDDLEYQVLTHEIGANSEAFLEEFIREKCHFVWGVILDHVSWRCLCYMLYCVVHSERFNLAYFMAKRMEWVTKQKRLILPYERKPRRDRDTRRFRHSTSSSSVFDQQSSSHLNDDDDDGNDEGTSCASTPSPIRYVNYLTNLVPQVFQNPPNIDPT
ncbi:retrovirus-related pol polyprotein from transposon TNT 1-94 [Tanacetum coccineum]